MPFARNIGGSELSDGYGMCYRCSMRRFVLLVLVASSFRAIRFRRVVVSCYSFSARRRFVLFVLVASSFRAIRFRPVVVSCYSFSSLKRISPHALLHNEIPDGGFLFEYESSIGILVGGTFPLREFLHQDSCWRYLSSKGPKSHFLSNHSPPPPPPIRSQGRHAFGQTDRQTDRQTDMQTDRHADRQAAARQADRQAGRPTDRQTGRDRQTEADRQTDKERACLSRESVTADATGTSPRNTLSCVSALCTSSGDWSAQCCLDLGLPVPSGGPGCCDGLGLEYRRTRRQRLRS